MKPSRRLATLLLALGFACGCFVLSWYSGSRGPLVIASTALGAFVGYAILNIPRRHRRHGSGRIEQAVDHSMGEIGRTYPEDPLPPERVDKIGRNDPCPCGSGLKYKQCCGPA